MTEKLTTRPRAPKISTRQRTYLRVGICAALFLRFASPALGAMTVLVGEPYGNFGTMMPVGHISIYLDRVCADGPMKLRMCAPGEPAGVVVARYHQIGDADWLATPVMQFLYGTDHAREVLAYGTRETVWELRQRYRRQYLRELVPDGTEKDSFNFEWSETVGGAYDRRFWGYQLATTEAQDRQFVAEMNAKPNHHAYRFWRTNCANFGADVVNFFFPGTIPGGRHIPDLGFVTPKQVARWVAAYGNTHPEAGFKILEIPQIPGSLRRSRPVRGSAEMLLTTKRYLATLLVIQPEVPLTLEIIYLGHGRWPIGRDAVVATPQEFEKTSGSHSDMFANR